MTTNKERPLNVFLCHASGDKPAVREIYKALRKEGIDVWLDEEKILPGQRWQVEIPKALRSSDAVLVCLSKKSITKEGYVQKEINFALDKVLEKPEGTIFLIPARLEECEVPSRLIQWQYVDIFRERGYNWLLRGLELRAAELGLEIPYKPLEEKVQKNGYRERKPISRAIPKQTNPKPSFAPVAAAPFSEEPFDIYPWGEIPFVKIPKGEFEMGEGKEKFKFNIPYDYWISRFEVTNQAFARFVEATGFKEGWGAKDKNNKPDHPVVNVSWHKARKYCAWLTKTYGNDFSAGWGFRLPTEAEWEKAARGTDARAFPWGNEFSQYRCNSSENGIKTTSPVDAYTPQGDSPYGVADMVGNVWEWTLSLYAPYPYTLKDWRENTKTPGRRVLRGGSFDLNRDYARCAFRDYGAPDHGYDNYGFRVCVSPISPNSVL